MPAESPEMSEPAPDMNAPQKYFVVYDTAGDEREEILRTGSNNVVSAFTSFYNDTFKGGMKNAIIKYKETKELQKKEAEKTEKAKVETDKSSKIKKFLGESQRNYLNAVHAISKLNEDYTDDFEDEDDEDRPTTVGSGPDEMEVDWDDLTASHDFSWDDWDSRREMIHAIEAFSEGENDMIGEEFNDALDEYGYCIDYDQPIDVDENDYGIGVVFHIMKCE
jgi:hypothetical protein